MSTGGLSIAMLALHSSPLGPVGRRDTGGMSVYLLNLARHLARRGHRVDLFTAAGPRRPVSLGQNVRLIPLGRANGRGRLHAWLQELDRHRRQTGYQVIHSHYWVSGTAALVLQRRWQVAHVASFHTLAAAKAAAGLSGQPPARLAAEQAIAERSHKVLVATEAERRHTVDLLQVAADKVALAPCGVDRRLFRPMDRPAACRQVGADAGRTNILYVGRFDPVKGIQNLVAALARPEIPPGSRLYLVGGDGPASDEHRAIEQQVRHLGLEHRVVLAGRQPHHRLPAYYAAADVLVLPSLYESCGLVCLEALACGTPVVAGPVGVAPELIRDGVNGYRVAEPTPAGLAAAIAAVVSHRADPQAVRATVAGLSWEQTARRTEELYRRLA